MSDGKTYERYTDLVIAALNLQQVRLYNENHENPHSDDDEMLAEEGVIQAAEALLETPAPAARTVSTSLNQAAGEVKLEDH